MEHAHSLDYIYWCIWKLQRVVLIMGWLHLIFSQAYLPSTRQLLSPKSSEEFRQIKIGLNFRIPGYYCVTLNACSRSPAVNKFLHMETNEKNFMYTRNKRATHEYYLVLKSISRKKRVTHKKTSFYNPWAETGVLIFILSTAGLREQ